MIRVQSVAIKDSPQRFDCQCHPVLRQLSPVDNHPYQIVWPRIGLLLGLTKTSKRFDLPVLVTAMEESLMASLKNPMLPKSPIRTSLPG